MTNLVKLPAMVDPHVHLRGMDWSHKGDFATETASAIAGGYWAVFDMPNTMPSTISENALARKQREFAEQALCDYGIYYGASADGNWTSYADVSNAVCGLKMFNNATTGNLLIADQSIREQHYKHWTSDKPISVHAEEETVLELLELVRKYRRRTHFLHISTAKEIQFLTDAKKEGLPITIGVCPHHLWLTEDDEKTLGAFGIMKPSLKTAHDRDALWKALQSGIVDVVESDHAPHTLDEKNSNTPPYGVTGLETTLPLLLTAVSEARLTLEQVIGFVSENPRKIWNLQAPDETYALIDLDAHYTIQNADMHNLCGWTPFDNMPVQGKVIETVIRGTSVYKDGQILANAGFGKNLYA